MWIKIIVTLFALHNIYKLILKFKDSDITLLWFLFWNIIWVGISVLVIVPQTSDMLVSLFGSTSRGIDFLVYIVILALVYAVFRLVIKIEHLEYEITQLVRHDVMNQVKQSKSKSL